MFDPLEFDSDSFQGGRYAADRGVFARFYTKPVEDAAASAEAGRPIFKDQEFVEIIAAGNANNIVQRKASNEDRQRFRQQYEKFKAGDGDALIGTPLSEVTWMTRSQVEELAYFRIRTIETLAEVSDEVCGRVIGLYDLKRKAKAVLEASDKAAPLTALQAENETLKNQVDAMKQQIDELAAALKERKAEK
jgi:hypothetical protein